MPKPGDIYSVPFKYDREDLGPHKGLNTAPTVCLLRCEPGDQTYRGVIVLEECSDGAIAGKDHILVPSAHTLSGNVLVLFMDLDVPISPASLNEKRQDFVCGDSLTAALMMAQDNLTGGFEREVLADDLATDEHPDETDVEDKPFNTHSWGAYHTMRKCRISDGTTTVDFFTGRGRPYYTCYLGDDAHAHARCVESIFWAAFEKWESEQESAG